MTAFLSTQHIRLARPRARPLPIPLFHSATQSCFPTALAGCVSCLPAHAVPQELCLHPFADGVSMLQETLRSQCLGLSGLQIFRTNFGPDCASGRLRVAMSIAATMKTFSVHAVLGVEITNGEPAGADAHMRALAA